MEMQVAPAPQEKFLEYRNGDLFFGTPGRKVAEVVGEYRQPIYVYDLNFIGERFRRMQTALKGAELYYAMKANPNRDILAHLRRQGARADVVSRGEIRAALQAGFSPRDLVYSGVGKTIAELEEAVGLGLHQINVESLPELERIAEVAGRLGKKASVALRLNPNIDIKTHPYIATGLHENKFGIELELLPRMEEVLRKNTAALELVGISLHLGSMMLEFDGFRQALRLLRPVYEGLRARFPTVARFDIGGGLGIIYDRVAVDEEHESLERYARIVREELAGLPGQIQTEPGRWIVAHGGLLIAQVQYIKQTSHKTFVIVDSGMNHLVRPAFYGSHHAILPVRLFAGRAEGSYDVVGPICESSDFFAKNRALPETRAGELLAIADCGAYAASMASTYNLQDLPREICIGG